MVKDGIWVRFMDTRDPLVFVQKSAIHLLSDVTFRPGVHER
jgi:hypothetical protein